MAVSEDRKYSKQDVYKILEQAKGKTLGEVDKSHQFARTITSNKITGIAGDVVEQSVFGYNRDSNQECDIEIDGVLTELKTTGVRVPKAELKQVVGKTGPEYNIHLHAKEGISITGVTFEPDIQRDFFTSHFWEKSERLLIVFYEYKSYAVVPASAYANFPIIDYCYNTFSKEEQQKLKNDWEKVRNYLEKVYEQFKTSDERNEHLVGFTKILRPNLLLIELVPGFKRKTTGGYQKPRYRLKQTFVDYLVQGHFNKERAKTEISLEESFSSFEQLDERCHKLTSLYNGKTLAELMSIFGIEKFTKDTTAKCVLRMFDPRVSRLNQISDFTKTGIIAKTIIITDSDNRTEDMKLKHVDFEEWADKNVDFEDSAIYNYFSEHSLLCPIFRQNRLSRYRVPNEPEEKYIKRATQGITFEGFKRLSFDDNFIEKEVRRTWEDSRNLIFNHKLVWEFKFDKNGNKRVNGNGSFMGAPNFPKSSLYKVFFRGGANLSDSKSRTEIVNGIRMLPQFIWLKGTYIANRLKEISYL